MRKIAENSGLTAPQEKLIQALLQYPTIKAAATAIGITDRTARTYMALPAFQDAYKAAQQELIQELQNGMIALASKASDGLVALIDDPECPAATRLKACQMVIDRIAPVPVVSAVSTEHPLQGNDLRELQRYLTPEELDVMDKLIQTAEGRRARAEQDRATIERSHM